MSLVNANWQLPTRHLGRRVLVFDTVDSTNDLATEAGTVVLADVQTAGRGQYGRRWVCPPGTAVQLSVALDPPVNLRRPVVLTAWATVAVAETVTQFTSLPARIKWPNDVLSRDKKVCGILIEQKTLVVVGIGLNVNQSSEQFAAAGLPAAGSLASIAGRQFDRDVVARTLIVGLDAEYAALLDSDLAGLESRWKSYVGLLEREVEIETIDGAIHGGRLIDMTFAAVTLESADGSLLAFTPESVKQMRG